MQLSDSKEQNYNGTEQPDRQWLSVRIADQSYGLEVDKVTEVVRYQHITSIPGSHVHVLGLINHRGRIVTVIDTCQRLALPASDVSDMSRIIIVTIDDEYYGILVDQVTDVIDLNIADIRQPAVAKLCVTAQSRQSDKVVYQLDLNQLVEREEEN